MSSKKSNGNSNKVVPQEKKSYPYIEVKGSTVHGNGLFAIEEIKKDEQIIEYEGEIITWQEADERHPRDPKHPFHTFYFQLEDSSVIDGGVNGNASRWINHACDPNTEAYEEEGRVFIYAIKDIGAGEEITYNYRLVLDEEYTEELRQDYACHCGCSNCAGTMLGIEEEDDSGDDDA